MVNSIELFSGAGGLAIGLEQAGFHHAALVELNNDACETIRVNAKKKESNYAHWNLLQQDAKTIHYASLGKNIELVAGGPPCQPFSLGGKHKGKDDHRDLFPEAVRAVREVRPSVFLFENVKGLVRATFNAYFNYIILQLTYPTLTRDEEETWEEHLSRLEKHHTANHVSDLEYKVVFRVLNAADFGVPQNRYRVFIVGFRSDLGLEWSFPRNTHCAEGLFWSKWVTGEYWDRHGISSKHRPEMTSRDKVRVERLKSEFQLTGFPLQAWKTVRDAISDLPDPRKGASPNVLNHEYRGGARQYAGHTGSVMDEPAKTLKAGDHGVPGGENMLVSPSGELRYFSTRESARLQTFPDDYFFHGSWTETMRQIGNAVPVRLAKTVGESILHQMETVKA
jgi:DNA (cytosine-5)-methyltransferase 1